jgi:demethylmenaquinone methyltransferase/2-methoxy-6-polyprenyl-1,4-benzoquinol methylase
LNRPAEPSLETLLEEQRAFYRAVAPEYEQHRLKVPGGEEVEAALDQFDASGHVLELACGTGTWTKRLLRDASAVTAVDASKEMLAITARRVGKRVRLIQADVFNWTPKARYNLVFFAFWLSHVPTERFEAFWTLVRACLKPEGRVFFIDDAYRTDDELIFGESSSTIRRTLKDGSEYRIVKVPHNARELEARLTHLGWRIKVHQTSGPFYWGSGTPS